MSYTAEISRANPSLFLFLIDRSGSMSDPWGADQGKSKAEGVSDGMNRLLQNLAIKCARNEGVRRFFQVGILGYGEAVGPALSGPLAGRESVWVDEVANHPARIEQRVRRVSDGAGGVLEEKIKFPVWFEPAARGGTPMTAVFRRAKGILDAWLKDHPGCYPPIVVNVTDGEATDGDPTSAARELRESRSADGEVLVFNVHISGAKGVPFVYAADDRGLPDEFAKRLFHMSSLLPPHTLKLAEHEGLPVRAGSRGFVFNGDVVSFIRFLDIGTRPGNLR